MNHMTTFILVMCGLSILFYAMGIDSHSNPLLDMMFAPQSMQISWLWGSITVAALSVGAAFYFGFIAKNGELAVMSVIMPIVMNMVYYFANVIILVMAASRILGILLLSPIMIYFAVVGIEYFRGRD